MEEYKREKHESFGLMGFSRSTRDGTNLFGSSIKHSNTIVMRVQRAGVDRHLNQDWFFAETRLPIIEVEMSQTQFATIITSMNMGDGFPVTIRSVEGVKMEECPHESKRQQHANEFKDRMKGLGLGLKAKARRIESLIDKMPKKDQKEVQDILRGFVQEIESNIPFFETQFQRQMDKTVTEAKGEVEAFVHERITSTGIKALADQYNEKQIEE